MKTAFPAAADTVAAAAAARVFGHGGLRFVLLQLIADKPSHGYELIKAIEDRLGGGYCAEPRRGLPNPHAARGNGLPQRGNRRRRRPQALQHHGQRPAATSSRPIASMADAMMARMSGGVDGAGPRGGRPPQVTRAIENLKLAMRMRLSGVLTEQQAHDFAAVLDQRRRRSKDRPHQNPLSPRTSAMTDFSTSSASTAPDRTPRRVRHDLRFRQLTVKSAQRVTPHLIRITLDGRRPRGLHQPRLRRPREDLLSRCRHRHSSRCPPPAQKARCGPQGRKPTMRDYTPRRHDAKAGTLEIDFALHEAGPATQWAEQAKPGDVVGVGGPRGSFIVPTEFDWHLLIGDDTALPAIARRLAELPAGARAVVLAEIDSEADEIPFDTQADLDVEVGAPPRHRAGPEPRAARRAEAPCNCQPAISMRG